MSFLVISGAHPRFHAAFQQRHGGGRQIVPRTAGPGDSRRWLPADHATGLSSINSGPDDLVDPGASTNRYRDGVFWLQARDGANFAARCAREHLCWPLTRTEPSPTARGQLRSSTAHCGQDHLAPIQPDWPGAMIGRIQLTTSISPMNIDASGSAVRFALSLWDQWRESLFA